MASNFYCTQCGKCGIPIPRKKGEKRESGHLKRLWCIHCQKVINHVEVQEFTVHYNYQDFLNEFNFGNFDKNGNRKMKYGLFKNELIKKGLI